MTVVFCREVITAMNDIEVVNPTYLSTFFLITKGQEFDAEGRNEEETTSSSNSGP